jgi:hypothetical protein
MRRNCVWCSHCFESADSLISFDNGNTKFHTDPPRDTGNFPKFQPTSLTSNSEQKRPPLFANPYLAEGQCF